VSETIFITLTDEQVKKIQPLFAEVIDETTDANGMILGTVTSANGEIIVGFEAVSHEIGREIINIAGGKTDA